MEEYANRLYLAGTLFDAPVASHACCGARFCRFTVSVLRKSGAADILPVLCEETLLPPEFIPGEPLTITGQVRAYSQRTETGSHLMVTAFAKTLFMASAPDENEVCIAGQLVKPPVYRCTPLGREIADLFVAVPRRFGKTDFLPVIAWGRNARIAQCRGIGDSVMIEGRLQSRSYTKKLGEGEEQTLTAYEVSAGTLTWL